MFLIPKQIERTNKVQFLVGIFVGGFRLTLGAFVHKDRRGKHVYQQWQLESHDLGCSDDH